MNSVTKKAYAKLNLTLDITGVSRGLHLLDMLTASVDIYDMVTVSEEGSEDICVMDGERASVDNSAVKALRTLRKYFKIPHFSVEIQKGIPVGGGLGGSSADGAAVISAVAELLDIPLKEISPDLLLEVGSDVAGMMTVGVKRVSGFGERVEKIPLSIPYNLGYIAGRGVLTAAAYEQFDKKGLRGGSLTERLIADMDKSDFDIARYLGNDLLIPAASLNGEVLTNLDSLKGMGATAVNMSGSGSTVYGLFSGEVPKDADSTFFIL